MTEYCVYTRTKPLKGFEGRGAFVPGCRLERCLGPLDAWLFGCPYCGKEIREKGKTGNERLGSENNTGAEHE
jgi:hypothetical protein